MSAGELLANVAITQGVFGIALVAGAVYFAIPFSALGVGDPLLQSDLVAIGVLAGLVLWAGNEIAAGVADAAGVGYDESVRSMLTPSTSVGWLLLLGVILPTVALVEELLFRAAAIGALSAGFDVSVPLLVVASSIAFGGAHGAQGRIGAVVATTLGIVLGVVFVLTDSLLVVVVAHYLVNALEFVVHEGIGVERPLTVVAGRRRAR